MELSKQTQTFIALFSGVILGALLVFMFMQNYYQSNNQQQTASTQQDNSRNVAEQQASNDASSDTSQSTSTPEAEQTDVPSQAVESAATSQQATATNQRAIQTGNQAYAYTARFGDSYSVLARKAVQSYGITQKVTLSSAQIVAAEGLLTTQAGMPELNEGQQVTMSTDSIKSAVETARKMNATEVAAWEAYTYDVDFNTNDNG